jgi:beta-lactamase regulating signal transducer with metallopeptidase domain
LIVTAETILAALIRIHLVASVAILLVLLLRPLVRRWVGASITYWLWLVVPVALAASFVPAREQVRVVAPPRVVAASRDTHTLRIGGASAAPEEVLAEIAAKPLLPVPALADLLVAVWLLGAGALLVRSIVRTRRLAADPSIGPALVGVLRPRLVLPADFETRFDAEERALILAHEDVHRVSGHTVVNALVEVARCASWFNPLVHLASVRVRTDQELACDAAVIATRPAERRTYAQALLKTQIAPAFLPLGCTWTSPSAKRMGERIRMLARPSLGRSRATSGAGAVAILGAALGYAAWAQQPERQVVKVAGWNTPAGLLSPIQAFRHEQFLPRAKAGNIDVVFFGDSDAEFWLWNDRGRSVWDNAFASFRAADFGSQGAGTKSTLWRMQHGELDGYRAKAVVLYALGVADSGHDVDEIVEGHEAIIAEIHKRQPEAKILLVANVRKWFPTLSFLADVNTRLAKLADDKTIFFIDFTDRFKEPDGSINSEMFSIGMREPGFEVWAEEIKPWLDRFGR